MAERLRRYTRAEIVAARPPKRAVDPRRPVAFLVEAERTAEGTIEDVATVFLANRECPFRCLMCDLWQNTTDERVPAGAIIEQLDYALARLAPAQHIKLYNSGNFFDPQAIPPEDHVAIAQRTRRFKTVIVENHPRLCGDACLRFQDLLAPALEIALGLETVHPDVLPALNKQMTLADFDRAARFLTQHQIAVRAFILLRPPPLTEQEGIDWALKSVAHAFDRGVSCCAIIPTRASVGLLERLQRQKRFQPPTLKAMEEVLASAIEMRRGRVFLDLWDLATFATCRRCLRDRYERLRQMNLQQLVLPPIGCDCESTT